MKELYNPKAFFAHAAWLRQAFAHCARFPTAASRRSLGRVSVPVWLIILSNQLRIVGLVSRYLTNYLIRRGPILRQPKPFPRRAYPVLIRVSPGYPEPKGTFPRVTHPSAANPEGFARLACVRPAASVRSEPGSNSQVDTRTKRVLTRKTPHIVTTMHPISSGKTRTKRHIVREASRVIGSPSKATCRATCRIRRRNAEPPACPFRS